MSPPGFCFRGKLGGNATVMGVGRRVKKNPGTVDFQRLPGGAAGQIRTADLILTKHRQRSIAKWLCRVENPEALDLQALPGFAQHGAGFAGGAKNAGVKSVSGVIMGYGSPPVLGRKWR